MSKSSIFAAALAVVLVGSGTAWYLVSGAHAQQDVIKERQQLMKSNGDQVKPLAAIAKGEAPFSGDVVQQAAATMQANFEKAAMLFPEGSTSDDSDALPVIWTRYEEFTSAMDDAVTAAGALAQVGADDEADRFNDTFMQLGRACTACHEEFRKPQG